MLLHVNHKVWWHELKSIHNYNIHEQIKRMCPWGRVQQTAHLTHLPTLRALSTCNNALGVNKAELWLVDHSSLREGC